MHRTTANDVSTSEVSILTRVLTDEEGRLPRGLARYVLTLGFDARDKARMHELAVRNQEGTLTAAEKEELIAYGKAGTLLSILESRARRTLGVKPRKRATS